MAFEFKETEIKGLMIIKPHMYPDDRGLYKKGYEKNIFAENGITCEFTESSDLYSKKGALRGLHYQTEESQAKLIHVISGILYDVAVDLREGSETFGKYHAELLKAEENAMEFIPEGFAHGFISLTDDTVFSYMCSGRYIPEACGGIRWNDPGLAISWPLEEYGVTKVIATDKDMNWPTLEEYIKKPKIKRCALP
ncbi:MAG: dTDP-4-dehydrorhamnose 3,5-epimerase [Lachnospiraceae bacterium]|nr:dTDP-4-dehydrorhamnose 3,5-epimerase [Lachnospiraceae bacterium]